MSIQFTVNNFSDEFYWVSTLHELVMKRKKILALFPPQNDSRVFSVSSFWMGSPGAQLWVCIFSLCCRHLGWLKQIKRWSPALRFFFFQLLKLQNSNTWKLIPAPDEQTLGLASSDCSYQDPSRVSSASGRAASNPGICAPAKKILFRYKCTNSLWDFREKYHLYWDGVRWNYAFIWGISSVVKRLDSKVP